MPREQAGGGDVGGPTDRGRDTAGERVDDWQRIESEKPDRDRIAKAQDAVHDPSHEFERAARSPDPEVKRSRPERLEQGDLTAEQRSELEEMSGQPIDHLLERRNEARANAPEPGAEGDRPALPQRSDLPDDDVYNQVIGAYNRGDMPYTEAVRRLEYLDASPVHSKPLDTTDPGEHVARERADRPFTTVAPEAAVDYYPTIPPTAEDRYFVRDQARPVPVFDGPPRREQVNQGQVGDCGILATLGGVAGHRPHTVENAITRTSDHTYAVTLHEVTPASATDRTARPTGDTVTLHMSDTIPVDTSDTKRPPLGVDADTCAWPALLEKAVAAQDQTWDQQQNTAWGREWNQYLKPDVDLERRDAGLPPSPRDAPTGYNRLDMGSTAEERANLLAELTGEQAEVRDIPGEQHGAQALLTEFRDQLADGKPILVGTRGCAVTEPLPRGVVPHHAYEVTKVENDKLHLRNPWGRDHPNPLDVTTFWEYYRGYNPDGSRTGQYSTLT